MRLSTAIVLVIWQAGKLWQLIENRRFGRRQIAFWDRHEKNMEAIRSGMPVPYPNNSHEWPEGESSSRWKRFKLAIRHKLKGEDFV